MADEARRDTLSDREALSSEVVTVSVVIPLFNEQTIVERNLQTLATFFDGLIGPERWGFVLVENGSTDNTPALVEAAGRRWPRSRTMHLAQPNYGAALRTGLQSTATPWVFIVDIEQWDLPFLNWVWNHREEYDLFIASKRADPTICFQYPLRRLLSCGLNALLQLFLGFTGTDTHGPKLVNLVALGPIVRRCRLDRGQFDTELVLRALRARMRVVELPVVYKEDRPPRNSIISKIVWNLFALRRLLKTMREVPYEGHVRLYRFSRDDVLAEAGAPAAAAMVG